MLFRSYDYFIEETLEAGLQLVGTEVKALREGRATITESYASVEGGGMMLINSYIPEYAAASRFNHEPRRHRRLLLHRRQIDKLATAIQREGRTLIPMRLYWDAKGRAEPRWVWRRGPACAAWFLPTAAAARQHAREPPWCRRPDHPSACCACCTTW